ncbi:Rare lipoprotein A precursor [Georgfuchsia toluolica]|uniref:Endolytic peptidoglycan transglycosylase RlpA n=1 Tax=Georgfuchsia toluolica TaxID=424218 RepID=A0A916J7X3_9PROT|nr:septal ring lytic transglycosylase RlpA family protein [Georgfuchsia toluolica]CAG4884820.1 Rare lipoprotein A precursor [Georgfuchsia toluolica]
MASKSANMILSRTNSLFCLLLLAACGSLTTGPAPVSDRGGDTAATPKRGGGYYKDDGPGEHPPANLDAIPDAVPKAEPLHRFANNPYSVLGQDYTPLREAGHYKARGLASWYGKKFHGQKTSTGDVYDMYAMTAAHPTLPIPSYARVTSLANGKSVVVRVNDRGPFHANRIIDLSYTAAWKLGLVGGGSGMVEVESLMPSSPLAPPALLAMKSDDVVPAKAAEDRPLPEVDDARGAWLQLGAFGNRDNAEALKSRLARELGDMGDKLVVRTAGNLFRVQLGPWADAQEARDIAAKLAELLEMKPVLVR